MSGSILGTHKDSPIDFGRIKVFFLNIHESPQWLEPKVFGKREKYWLVDIICTEYGSYALNYQCMRKKNFIKIMCSINITQHAYIRRMISQFNIIVTQHIDHRSNTCAMRNIEPHNPIQEINITLRKQVLTSNIFS